MHAGLSRGYGDLLKPVAFRGDLIFAPSEGQNVRFALPEPFEPLAAEEATRELARRYLTRYGPATREELAKWFGAPVARRARALDQGARRRGGRDRVRLGAARRRGRDRAARRRPASSGCCPRSTSTSSPRPRDDRATSAPERIYRPGGWFSPVLLVDGVMAGVWRREGDAVTIEPFAPVGAAVRAAAEAEAARLPGAPAVIWRANLRATPPLVTISASYGAGGSQIGPALAQRLGVEFLDRAIPTRVADRLQVPLDDALAHDESLGDAIGRLVSSFALLPELAGAMVQAGVLAGEDYRRETERLIREHAEGGAVILGRAGAVILRDASATRCTCASTDRRERRVAQGDGARGPRAAADAERLRKSGDRAREAYVRHFYGCDARDPSLYHLVIDSTALLEDDRGRDHRGRRER